MTALEVLIAARARIATPDRWCKGAYWRDADGSELERYGTDCVACCAHGAMHDNPTDDYLSAYHVLSRAINSKPLAPWNDAPERTHAEVLAAFDKAIELAGGAK